ncbi:MDR family MFS transporter [Arthrobacter sp. ISL-72]|uniref:MDR family MFS transporter n=1 Tax=Arthrobacter sp. ISL-72 TaxID=2819114 RepID=UPI001BE7C8FE|nr:MDR family MFS transporter [Arthrobacter sp. ISL-72]MBT2597140.1 MFS transporter [Arthrobacter sp. ISL-72]
MDRTEHPPLLTAGVRRALPGILLVMFLGALDQTVMASALPTVAGDLRGLDQMPAIITGYLVAATAAMPLTGKLGDAFGRKKVLQASLVVFILGAALCSLAQSVPELIAYRAVQGTGGGGLMIGAQTVIGELVSPRDRGRFLGIIGAAFIVAAVVGPLAGGAVVDHLSWRWIFYFYVPLGLAALAVVTLTLRLPAPPGGRHVDYGGAALLSLAIVSVILLCSTGSYAGPAWVVPALVVLSVLSLAGWIFVSLRTPDPIIPLALFRDAAFAIPTAVSFLLGFAMFATLSYLPAFLQVGMGMSATASGGMLIALMAGILITTAASGALITRTGRYKLYPVAGTLLAVPGVWLFSTMDAGSSPWSVLFSMLLLGLGIGLVMQVMVLVVQNAVDRRDLGAATSTVTFLRQVGSSVGVAVLGTLITVRFAAAVPAPVAAGLGDRIRSLTPKALEQLPPPDRAAVAEAFGHALPPVFGYAALVLAVAFVLTLFLPERELRTTAHADTVHDSDPTPGGAPHD